MTTFPHFWPWVFTMLLISITPGAGAVASMSSGATHGWRRGIWTSVGQQIALLALLLVAAVGLSALLATSPRVIFLLTLLGAGYLCWIGFRLLYTSFAPKRQNQAKRQVIPATKRGMLLHGFLVNAGNPKALLSLFVITPKFIAPDKPLLPQYFGMALSMVTIDLFVMAGYTAVGSALLRSLNDEPWKRRTDAFFGVLFVIAGILVAVT